jgi:hypothetical protein
MRAVDEFLSAVFEHTWTGDTIKEKVFNAIHACM